MRHLGQLVVKLLAQPPGQEGEALQKAFDIGILTLARQVGSQARILAGELVADLAQIRQLVLEVTIDAHRTRTEPSLPKTVSKVTASSPRSIARSARIR